MKKNSEIFCVICDLTCLFFALINPVIHLNIPLDKFDVFQTIISQDIWVILLTLSLLLRSPILVRKRYKTFEEWIEEYKNVR